MRARDFACALDQLRYRVEILCAEEAGGLDSESGSADGFRDLAKVQGFPSTWIDRLVGALGWLAGAPLQAAPFVSRSLRRAALERLRELGPGDVVVVQLVRQLSLLKTLVDALAARSREERPLVVVDLIDTLSLNFAQRAELDRWWKRPVWRAEARRLRRAELAAVELADRATVVCDRDLRALAQFAPLARSKGGVLLLPIESAEPSSVVAKTELEAPRVVLSGNLGYFVNRRAVERFVEDTWPHVRDRVPSAELVVAGARPPSSLTRKLRSPSVRGLGVKLVADPPHLRAVLRSATVAVAPLAGGAGVPVKVLEAWAERTPLVASSWAVQGVAQTEAEVDLPLVSVEDGAPGEVWAEAVASLLLDHRRRAELADRGHRRLSSLHSVDAFRASLAQIIGT